MDQLICLAGFMAPFAAIRQIDWVVISVKTLRKLQIPAALFAILSLFSGMWGGLSRMGMSLDIPFPNMAAFHGVLMVSGFLGTLIILERSVALEWGPGYFFALLSAVGAFIVGTGWGIEAGMVMIILAGIGLLSMYVFILSQQPAWHTLIMALGGVLWFFGDIFWLQAYPFAYTANLWAGFLILTVVGERIELSRMVQTRDSQRSQAGVLSIIFMLGLLLHVVWTTTGVIISALTLIILAVWLLKNDLARFTIKQTGLPKYMAFCLLTGFVWLIVGSVVSVLYLKFPDHLYYDAYLHSFFLGFIFSMIFAHAPVIFPSLTGRQVGHYDRFYIHYLLLQISLIIRLAGDFMSDSMLRELGGVLNGLAIVIFLVSTLAAIFQTQRSLKLQTGELL